MRAAGKLLGERGLLQGVADEGGYWPAFASNEEALDMLLRAIERAGFCTRQRCCDLARYRRLFSSGATVAIVLQLEERELDSDGLIELLGGWIARYPIVSVEDPVAEDDAEGFRRFTKSYGARVQVVGDDFLVTDAARVRQAAASKAVTTALIKPNQAGTLTETLRGIDRRAHGGADIHRFRALGGKRGRHHRPSRGRLGCRPAQGRFIRALGTHGEMERGLAHRRGARSGCAFCRRRSAGIAGQRILSPMAWRFTVCPLDRTHDPAAFRSR